MTANDSFVPALGRSEWTWIYDFAIALLTREGRWRRALIDQCAPKSEDVILDVGCGTGTLVVLLKRRAPHARVAGLDPDPDILVRAQRKAKIGGLDIAFHQGFARDADYAGAGHANKIISSLVFHQTPLEEKRAGFAAMYRALRPGGELHIADYGLQRTALMRRLFRRVQQLDGFENTEPNALGVLPELMREAGFAQVAERKVIPSPTGSISLYFARKPDA